ncbi:hypothetical protein [Escherichia phage AnYang]|uniref:Uncharacterized protein n=1 Tax=Escherichia phage AnYang TaxID=2499909 RepID=A0A410T4I9_9CAUD|nr:hypothetical protein KNU29_gp070 [Escherichia phage AnYang]QAU03605.1 hypothetical protein [Escherichia phage AnYang]
MLVYNSVLSFTVFFPVGKVGFQGARRIIVTAHTASRVYIKMSLIFVSNFLSTTNSFMNIIYCFSQLFIFTVIIHHSVSLAHCRRGDPSTDCNDTVFNFTAIVFNFIFKPLGAFITDRIICTA